MKDKQQSTFEDILLELMVQNETLDKIQVNTLKALDLVPTRQEKKEEEKPTVEPAALSSGTAYDTILGEICEQLVSLNKSVLGLVSSGEATVDSLNRSSSSVEAGMQYLAAHVETLNNRARLIMEDVSFITNLMSDEAGQRRIDRLKQDENSSEMIALLKRLGSGGGETKDTTVKGVDKPATFMEKLLGALGIIGGLVGGFVAGIVGYFTNLFKDITAAVAKLLKIDQFLAKIGLDSKFLEKLTKPFKMIGEFLKKLFAPAAEMFSSALKGLKELFSGDGFLGKIGQFFEKLKNYMKGLYDSFLSKFGKFFGIGKLVGVIVGKLLVFWDVFKSISAAFDKFGQTGDIGEAIGTGVKELVGRIIGAPLDLLKSAISWILGKFGFEEAESFLDSFDFTELINEYIDRLLAWGRETFEQVFQSVVDIWDDITKEFKSGNILGGIIEIFRGLGKFLLALPANLIKNSMATIGEFFGADMSSVRKFDFAEYLGGTNTATTAKTKESPQKGILEAAQEKTIAKRLQGEQERVDAHIAEQDRLLKEEADKKSNAIIESKSESKGLLGILGTFDDAQKGFMNALMENLSGGQTQTPIGAMPSTVGSEMAAIQSNTDQIKAETSMASASNNAAAPSKKAPNVSAQSVTYNSSNIPDRTSWMTMPLANWGM